MELISYAAGFVLLNLGLESLPAVACLSDRVCEESTKVTSEDIASGLAARAEAFFDESPKGMADLIASLKDIWIVSLIEEYVLFVDQLWLWNMV